MWLPLSALVAAFFLLKRSSTSSPAPHRLIDAGVASWYPPTGNPTANGEFYDGSDMTAAHKTLPFGTIVDVRDIDTGNVVRVRVNDRGPFVAGRVIDLSPTAAAALGIKERGLANVEVFAA